MWYIYILIVAGNRQSPVSLLKSMLKVGTLTRGWPQCDNCWKWTQSPVSCWRVWWNYCVQYAASLLQIHTALAGCTSPAFFYQHQTDHRPAGEGSLRHEPEIERSKEVTDTLQRRIMPSQPWTWLRCWSYELWHQTKWKSEESMKMGKLCTYVTVYFFKNSFLFVLVLFVFRN